MAQVSPAILLGGDPAQRPFSAAGDTAALRRPHAEDLGEAAALHAWRRADVDELVLEADDLQLLAHLRHDEDTEAATI